MLCTDKKKMILCSNFLKGLTTALQALCCAGVAGFVRDRGVSVTILLHPVSHETSYLTELKFGERNRFTTTASSGRRAYQGSSCEWLDQLGLRCSEH